MLVSWQMELQQTLYQILDNLQQLSTQVPNISFSIKVNVLEQCVYQPSFIQIKDGEIKDERYMAIVSEKLLSGLISNDQHIILLS